MSVSPERTSPDIVEKMVQAGVLADTSGSEYRLTRELETYRDQFKAEVESKSRAALRSDVEAVTSDSTEADALLDVSEITPAIFAEFLALHELGVDDTFTQSDILTALSILDSFRNESPPAHGSPDAFLPVSGQRIPLLATIYEKAIVYIWLDDCDPCETVRADLDEIFNDVPTDIALFSVYGPDHAGILDDAYDVSGGPTVLFFHNGDVDARLYGAQYKGVLATEVQKHRDL